MRKPWSREARYMTLAIIIALVLLGVWYIRDLLNPLIIAGLIAYILMPAVNLLKLKFKRMSHVLAVNLVYFLGLAIAVAIPAIVLPIFAGELDNLVSDLLNLPTMIDSIFSKPLVIAGYSINLQPYLPNLANTLSTFLNSIPSNLLKVLESTSKNAAWFLVILVTIYYLLIDWDKVRNWMIHLAPRKYTWDVWHLYLQIKKVWSAYLRGTLALMFIVGLVFTIVYLIIGLPGALIIGFLAGLFSLVPELGPLVTAIIATSVALVEGSYYLPLSHFWFAFLVVGIYVVLINLKGIWLRPRIMGRSVHLNEGLVFVAIMAAIVYQGILGALIVIPVIASVVVISRYLRRRILAQPPFILKGKDKAMVKPREGKKQKFNKKKQMQENIK
jgi:predicted PurR-regulated permease PerM